MRGALVAAALLAMVAPAAAERLEISLSSDTVNVSSEFKGTRLSLFGVIERDETTVSRTGLYELVVVVNGPPHDVLIQQKARRLGIWMNGDGATFDEIPSYYAVLTTEGTEEQVAAWLDALPRTEGVATPHERFTGRRAMFYSAFAEKQAESGLYVEEIGGVEKLTSSFFRTTIDLPGVADNGDYTVAVYLLADGVPLEVSTTGFTLAKVGLEQRVFEMSRQSPLLYGFAVVALALVTGYVGGVVFRRN